MASGSPNTDGDAFYVSETRWLVRNRVYRIWASPRGLAAAYVAGSIYNEASARLLGAQLYINLPFALPLFRVVVRRCLAKRAEREAVYASTAPWSEELLRIDSRNFQIPRADLVQIHVDRSPSVRSPFGVGTCTLELKDGSRRRLMLLTVENTATAQERILATLKSLDCPLKVEGAFAERSELAEKVIAIGKAVQLSPRQRRFAFFALLAVCATIAISAAAIGWLQPAKRFESWLVSAAFAFLAAWLVIELRRNLPPKASARQSNYDLNRSRGPSEQ